MHKIELPRSLQSPFETDTLKTEISVKLSIINLCVVWVAVNVYQRSPPELLQEDWSSDKVEARKLAEIDSLHDIEGLTGISMASIHSSFIGGVGVVTQILNVLASPEI